MNSNNRVFLAIAVLAFAVLACQAVNRGSDGGDIDIPNVPEELPTIEVPEIEIPDFFGGDVLLSDDFSTEGWGTGTDAESGVEYVNETLNFIVNESLYFVWSTPDGEDYENIHVEVTAINNSTDSTSAFGIMCNLQITDTTYYFAITGAGQYAIGLSTLTDETILTNGGEWGESSLIEPGASSYRIGADCGSDGTLTLYVDGQVVDTANDTGFTTGGVALFAWSGEAADSTDVSFDDFEMKMLP